MFFFLSNALFFLIKPFSWIIFAFLWMILTKNTRRRKLIGVTLVAGLLFFSNTVIFLEVCRLYEDQGIKHSELEQYDVGIVLTGFGNFNNDLSRLELHYNGDRMWQALQLYNTGKIKKLLISGDSGYVSERGLHEAQQTRDVLLAWGIPSDDIIVEGKSRNTHENAVMTMDLLRKKYPELKNNILITSGLHVPRALACFEKQGANLDVFSSNHYTGAARKYQFDQFVVPSAETLTFWEYLFKEWIGYIVYDIVGYI